MIFADRFRTFYFRAKGQRAGLRQHDHKRYSTSATIGLWTAGVIGLLVLLVIVVAYFADEPLRRRMERNLNSALKGYTVRIGRLDFHPIGLSLDLEESTIVQNEIPDPPVAYIPNLTASIDWRALLYGRVVADFEIDNPRVYINRKQTKKEVEDDVPIEERGWQEALQEIYPLEINNFVVRDGELTYVDEGPFRPLKLSKLNFHAENIRNVRSDPGVYPSGVHLDGVVFERGKLVADGFADFLAEPHVSFKADLSLDQVDLDYFKPIIERYNFTVHQGSLLANANVEYAAHTKFVKVSELRIKDVNAEYIHKSTESAPKTVAKEVDRTAKEQSDSPTLEITVDQVHINGRLGLFNAAREPQYRVFWDQTDLRISNFSNQSAEGAMVGKLTGRFMGSGKTEMVLQARPDKKGPDLDLKIAIENTDMKLMNNLLRSYGNFDVVAGLFSFYSDLSVRDGNINGYVKPLFYEMDVYDRRQDKEKSLFRKLYEGIIGGLSMLLQNTPRDEVATNITVSGKLSNPQTSTWETVLGLVQNAFFKAILPGFEREATSDRKKNQPRRTG
jgi:hypothetical protein